MKVFIIKAKKTTVILAAIVLNFSLIFYKSSLSSCVEAKPMHINADFFDQYQEKAAQLVAQMTLEEKIGQMLLPSFLLLQTEKPPQTLDSVKAVWKSETDLKVLGNMCGFDLLQKYHIGAVLQAGSPMAYFSDDLSAANWKKLSEIAKSFYSGPTGTALLLGTDAIHGDQHVIGSILFPHNIGLGVTHNPDLTHQVAYWTSRNMQDSGFNWSFMPTVAISHDYRWGRTYESFSSDPYLVKVLSSSYIKGLQNIQNEQMKGVLASVKHFIGDGDTMNGVDQGLCCAKDIAHVWEKNGAGYEGAVEANAGSLMVSYSLLNNIPMHFGGDFDILNQFRNQGIKNSAGHHYQLGGFVVSDYNGISCAAHQYNTLYHTHLSFPEALIKAINSGIDMLMVSEKSFSNPFDYNPDPPYEMKSPKDYENLSEIQQHLINAIKGGRISLDRINDAVTRILRTKLSMANQKPVPLTLDEHKQESLVALQAAEQSLVLLKNQNQLLPLNANLIKTIILLGDYDDIGTQNGGWTVAWQGDKGNKYWSEGSKEKSMSSATSLLDGIKTLSKKETHLILGEDSLTEQTIGGLHPDESIAIIAISEPPYAEFMGDVNNQNPQYLKGALINRNKHMPIIQTDYLGVNYSEKQLKIVKALEEKGIKVITILFSGRPLIITEPLNLSHAFIAAFLPGTSGGQALANAIFGRYAFKSVQSKIGDKTYFSNTLPFGWPAGMDEVRSHQYTLFPLGYGLETEALE